MKTIELNVEETGLVDAFSEAEKQPVLLLTNDGREFILDRADDFHREVEALRNSEKFQGFLDERMNCKTTSSLDEIEREVDDEIRRQAEG